MTEYSSNSARRCASGLGDLPGDAGAESGLDDRPPSDEHDDAAPEARGGGQAGLWAQMRQVAGVVFGLLSQSRRQFFTMPNCYELFGLDFAVDRAGRAWLLEANPEPSLEMFGLAEAELLGGDGAPSPLDSPPRDGWTLVFSSAALKLLKEARDAKRAGAEAGAGAGAEAPPPTPPPSRVASDVSEPPRPPSP